MQNVEVVKDFLPLELGSSHVILGIKWLATLGETQVDWGSLVMKFRVGGTVVTLHGDPSLKQNISNFEVNDEGIMRKWRRSATGIGKLDS